MTNYTTTIPQAARAIARAAASRGNHVRAAWACLRAGDDAAAYEELDQLAAKVRARLALRPEDGERLQSAFPALLAPASGGRFTRAARALFDLQTLCTETGTSLDLVEWLRTLGKQPMRRPLAVRQALLAIRRLRRIRKNLGALAHRVPDAKAVYEIIDRSLQRDRDAFRRDLHPRVLGALEEAGFRATDPIARAELDKLVARLLDQTLRRGGLDFGVLRDTIAESYCKLGDIDSIRAVVRSDALLRADELLASALDGAYFRGEAYVRVLHRIQRVLFGSEQGRVASRFILAPALGSVTILEFFNYLIGHVVDEPALNAWPNLLVLAVVLAFALNSGIVARWVAGRWRSNPPRGRAARSKRLAAGRVERTRRRAVGKARTFWHVYRDIADKADALSFVVDEWVWFRFGHRRGARVIEAVLVLGWFLAGYVLRLLARLFVEPTVNPIKHFPVVTVAGKVSIATGLPVFLGHSLTLAGVGGTAAYALSTLIAVFMVPGFCGYLAWEIRFNWRLFGANLGPNLGPSRVGPDGETLVRLLRPGVASGTLPKLLARLAGEEDRSAALELQRKLDDVQRSVHRFVERELLGMLRGSRMLGSRGLECRSVELGGSEVLVRLAIEGDGSAECTLELVDDDGELRGSIADDGLCAVLGDDGTAVLEAAIIGFFIRAGATWVEGLGRPVVRWDQWVRFWREESNERIEPWWTGTVMVSRVGDATFCGCS